MRKIISSIIVSLDGLVAGPKGELDMFKVGEEFFGISEQLTEAADTALYGKGTYYIMQSYWPTAADKPDASEHDKQHAEWYKRVHKVVLSTTLKSSEAPNATIISSNIAAEITRLKQQAGKSIQIFGSPGAVSSLTREGLIDEYWIFVFPVIIGNGIPLFREKQPLKQLKLLSHKTIGNGAVALHYAKS